jgi:hypothetical protein
VRTGEVTLEESTTLVRNLLRTSISTVCFVRSVFPESFFVDRTVSGVRIKSLSPADHYSKSVLNWLETGVFDALRLKYLRMLSFGFYRDKDEKELIEAYEFKVSYPDSGATVKLSHQSSASPLQNKAEITANMRDLMLALSEFSEELEPLPDTRYISMKIFYYEDITPLDYNPKYFEEMTQETRERYQRQQKQLCKAPLGSTATRHHTFDVRLTAPKDSFLDHGEPEEAEETEGAGIEAKDSENPPARADKGVVSRNPAAGSEAPLFPESVLNESPENIGRVAEILRQKDLSGDDKLYLQGIMYALTADTVPPSKIAKLIGIKLIESKELLLLLERDGFVEMAANMRSRLSVRSRENMTSWVAPSSPTCSPKSRSPRCAAHCSREPSQRCRPTRPLGAPPIPRSGVDDPPAVLCRPTGPRGLPWASPNPAL